MLIAQHADQLVVWAPAKVNLYLEVLAKRSDGYHEIASVMLTVSLYDTLAFMEDVSGAVRLTCSDPALSTGDDNLVLRAAKLLQRSTGCTRGAFIGLTKRIPMAAGLAGGSSDAAATLAGLNRLWGLELPAERLAELGAQIGSDVAFFFTGPLAWCTGRGEKVAPLPLGQTLWLVLLSPNVGLATADVYRNVTVPSQPETGDAMRQALASGEPEVIGRCLHNRLQAAAERLCPTVAEACARLRSLQPAGALMSGSGTSLFALCRGPTEALQFAHVLRSQPESSRSRICVVRSSC